MELMALPELAFAHVCALLPASTLLKAGCCCKMLRAAAADERLWKNLCISRWASFARLTIALPSFKHIYKQRLWPLVAKPPEAKLQDFTLLVDLTAVADGKTIVLHAASLPLTRMVDGNLGIGSFEMPVAIATHFIREGSVFRSMVRIEAVILRNKDGKTLEIPSTDFAEVLDSSEELVGRIRRLPVFYETAALPSVKPWFIETMEAGSLAHDVDDDEHGACESQWVLKINLPSGAEAVGDTKHCISSVELQFGWYPLLGGDEGWEFLGNDSVLRWLASNAPWR